MNELSITIPQNVENLQPDEVKKIEEELSNIIIKLAKMK